MENLKQRVAILENTIDDKESDAEKLNKLGQN